MSVVETPFDSGPRRKSILSRILIPTGEVSSLPLRLDSQDLPRLAPEDVAALGGGRAVIVRFRVDRVRRTIPIIVRDGYSTVGEGGGISIGIRSSGSDSTTWLDAKGGSKIEPRKFLGRIEGWCSRAKISNAIPTACRTGVKVERLDRGRIGPNRAVGHQPEQASCDSLNSGVPDDRLNRLAVSPGVNTDPAICVFIDSVPSKGVLLALNDPDRVAATESDRIPRFLAGEGSGQSHCYSLWPHVSRGACSPGLPGRQSLDPDSPGPMRPSQ